MGVLESLVEQVVALERLVANLASEVREVRTPAPTPDPADVWAEGAVDLATAEREYGISRTELYRRMNAGKLTWSQPTRERLVPRKALRLILGENERRTSLTPSEAAV